MRKALATVAAALCLLGNAFSEAVAAPYNDVGDVAAFSFTGEGYVTDPVFAPAGQVDIVTANSILDTTEEFQSLAGLPVNNLTGDTFFLSTGTINNLVFFSAAFDRSAVTDPAGTNALGSETGNLSFRIGVTTTSTIDAAVGSFQLGGNLSITASTYFDTPVQGSWIFSGIQRTGTNVFDYEFDVFTPARSIGVVPLPAGLPLLVGGLGVFGWIARRKSKQA